jgi:hypothetical protein
MFNIFDNPLGTDGFEFIELTAVARSEPTASIVCRLRSAGSAPESSGASRFSHLDLAMLGPVKSIISSYYKNFVILFR